MELQAHGTKVEMGAWQARTKPVRLRIKVEPEERSMKKPEGWKDEV